MKSKIALLIGALALPLITQAAPVPLFSTGDYVFAGTLYLDNDADNDGSNLTAAGVGNVTEIRRGDGSLFWDNSTEELSIAFGGFHRNTLAPGIGGTTQFSSDGGIVNFYTNALGTFQATGNFIADALAISGGTQRLSLVGAVDGIGNVAIGQFSSTSYSSNGYLDVVAGVGDWASIFDTNALTTAVGSVPVDMTFNISGDNTATGQYDYSGSADLATHAVPSPRPLLLMGTALMGIGFVSKKGNKKQ